jgi:hypothetical protein
MNECLTGQKHTSSPSMNGTPSESAMCFATVLFPHPAGPVTSQICCSLVGESVAGVAPLTKTPWESADLGDGGMLWRPEDMAPDDEGLCPLIATEVLKESMAVASRGMRESEGEERTVELSSGRRDV